MGLFGLFGKSPKQREEEESQRRAREEDLEVYSGMRVEVTSDDGRMFLVAVLTGLRGDRAQLRPATEGGMLTPLEEPALVTLRGYSSKENKAVIMKCTVRSGGKNFWLAEHLSLIKRSNDRAFFRMGTSLAGRLAVMGQENAQVEECRLLNISVGGACISTGIRHNVGDKFLLRTKLTPNSEPIQVICQIVRINERRYGSLEYGCRFLNLSDAEEDRIVQVIFDMQRQGRT